MRRYIHSYILLQRFAPAPKGARGPGGPIVTSKEQTAYRRTKEWKAFAKKLNEFYGYRCQLCGTKHDRGLHPHHLDPSTYGHETLTDVIPLCAACHKWTEYWLRRMLARKKSFQWNKYTLLIVDIVQDFTTERIEL